MVKQNGKDARAEMLQNRNSVNRFEPTTTPQQRRSWRGQSNTEIRGIQLNESTAKKAVVRSIKAPSRVRPDADCVLPQRLCRSDQRQRNQQTRSEVEGNSPTFAERRTAAR